MIVNLKNIFFIFLIVLLILSVSVKIVQQNQLLEQKQELIVELNAYGIEEYFLFENFGKDITLWNEEQVEVANNYLNCISEWWEVATDQQKEETSRSLVAWICWGNYGQ